mmetsp:Transcript_10361/g.11615  ORF Transcript_10361/g.11615 Transcript_10361/m.11615 type:complete len:86 (+) Transcript_10361:1-258(+)
MIVRHYKREHSLAVDLQELNIDTFDLVHDQSELQLLKVIHLIIGLIIKSENDTYIGHMIELDEDDREVMQTICQQALQIMETFKA